MKQNLGVFKTGIVGAIAVAGLAATLVIRQRADATSRDQCEMFREQESELATRAACQNLKSAMPVAVKRQAGGDPGWSDLQRLRAEAKDLRRQAGDLEKKLEQTRKQRKYLGVDSLPADVDYTPEQLQQRQAMSAGKVADAENLSQAIWRYQREHHGQIPGALDQIAPDLEEMHAALTGTNEFDLVYSGAVDDSSNFPTQVIAVLRERQPWLAPSGKWARVYGMLTVPPRVVESDDNFQAGEAEHIIPPATGGPGQ